MQNKIAFFDFDGTITRRDTMLEFVKFVHGHIAFYLGMMMIAPWLIGLKLKIVSKTKAKEKLLSYFFKGMSLTIFNEHCKYFNDKALPKLIREDALHAIKFHQNNNHTIVIVTASAENWVQTWANQNGMDLLATQLSIDNNMHITGKLKSTNCNGIEKVNRINAKYNLKQYEAIYCYGDTKGDEAMLSIATHPFYRHFKG